MIKCAESICLNKKNIERYDKYFKDGDYLILHMGDEMYEIVRIIDMQPGAPQFIVESCKRKSMQYYFSKENRLNPTRFKVIMMFQ